MPVFVVTNTTGGKTRPTAMTVVPPDHQMMEDRLRELAVDGELNGAVIADLLSACLAHERAGTLLYRCVAEKTRHSEWRERYRHFRGETEEHVRILEDAIRQLGGDPMYVSPAARMTEFLGTKLMEPILLAGSVDDMTTELTCIEAVMLAETKDRANWQLMAVLAGRLRDSEAKRILQAAVDRVLAQEEEHVSWASSTWQQAIMSQAMSR
jgi:rubrerythrin